MLIRGLSFILFFQLLGTAISELVVSNIPGPIIGLLVLWVFLLVYNRPMDSLIESSEYLLQYLPLLIIPSAVGVVSYTGYLLKYFWAILGSLVLSLVLSLSFVSLLMQRVTRKRRSDGKKV